MSACAPFLRLDFLYSQALYHNEMASQWGSRAAVSCLIDILAIATRGDVRSEVLKELERQLTSLNEFQSKPGVDSGRLRAVMSNLLRLRAELMSGGLHLPAADPRLRVPERHQAPKRHSRRHLRV
jgi:cell division protein ZapD